VCVCERERERGRERERERERDIVCVYSHKVVDGSLSICSQKHVPCVTQHSIIYLLKCGTYSPGIKLTLQIQVSGCSTIQKAFGYCLQTMFYAALVLMHIHVLRLSVACSLSKAAVCPSDIKSP
jgi:hypothetical protein